MTDTVSWIDGNALGDPLGELLGVDVTDAAHGCQSCGATRPVAEHHLHHGLGIVLRCPVCSEVGLVVARLPDRRIVYLTGAWQVDIPHPDR